MAKIFRNLYVVWSFFWFIFIMILIFPLVIIGSFWGKVKGGNFIYKILHAWADIWFPMIGVKSRMIYEEMPDPECQYVFVANHISNLDAAFIIKALRQPFRPLGKIELQSVPVFGFIYKSVVVVVDRSNPEHRARSIRVLRSFIQKGISILIFPEGTFNETERPLKRLYDGAFRLAIETQTPIKPIIFPDTYSRLKYDQMFSLNPGPCRAVFLETVPVEGLTLNDLPRLKQQVDDLMSAKLRHYNAAWIGDE